MKDKLQLFNIVPSVQQERLPLWLRRRLPKGTGLRTTHGVIQKNRLNTVCEEALCPNLTECYSKKTATFLAMGKACTRACGFCEIDFAQKPLALDPDEPMQIARSVQELGLKHVVITMVARDDLSDGGATHLTEIVRHLRPLECTVELLTSDFEGNEEALSCVAKIAPDIFNHNIETVRRLSPRIRHKAQYDRSLSVLKYMKDRNLLVKSGIMVGLGEQQKEVEETLQDLQAVGCDMVTIGQYLRPSKRKLSVQEYIHPDQFKHYEEYGKSLGLRYVYSGPFVRSSYNAQEVLMMCRQIMRAEKT